MRITPIRQGRTWDFFVCGGKLRTPSQGSQYCYKKQPSKLKHYVRKKNIQFF